MGSNPDEFVPDIHGKYPPKWRNIILAVYMRVDGGKDYRDHLPFLTDKEIKALHEKMQSLQGDLFTKQVMNILLSESIDAHPPTTIAPPLTLAELSSLSWQVTGGSPKGSF
jgi:hypothetical protein